MPNPIIGRIVTSKRKVDDRPKPVPPTPEQYAGDNIPYRGVVEHGQPVDDNWRDPADDLPQHDGRLVDVYEHESVEPDPIPVYIVNQSSRERRAFRTMQSYAGGTDVGVMRIVGQDDSRTRLTIKVPTGAQTVWVADDSANANSVVGFPIAAGESYTTETQEALYASVAQPAQQVLYLAVEYRVNLDG